MIKKRLIQWLMWLLATLGEDLTVRLLHASVERDMAKHEVIRLQQRETERQGRHAVLHEVINGLMADARRLDLAPQGPEWKRHQLSAIATRQYARVSEDVRALGVAYAVYYIHQEHPDAKAKQRVEGYVEV